MIKELLPGIKHKYGIDFFILNGENAAHGTGMSKKIYDELMQMGLDVITSGNHIFDKKEFIKDIDACPHLLRPANYPPAALGKGSLVFNKNGIKVGVFNLSGRVFMPCLDCPFRTADQIISELKKETPIILLDLHAEATSEKSALGWYLDGRVSAVLGTHTHIQTADEQILPHGTAFISDVGMVGAKDSVIGVTKKAILERFTTAMPREFDPEEAGPMLFNAVVVEIDSDTGRAQAITRIFETINP